VTTLDILVSFLFPPLDLSWRENCEKQNEKVGDLCVRYSIVCVWGGGCVTQLRAGLRISRLPMGSFRAVSKVTARPHLRDLATFPFTFIRWQYNPRHADIFIWHRQNGDSFVMYAHTQRERESFRVLFFLLLLLP
jgi:hypothetical protein